MPVELNDLILKRTRELAIDGGLVIKWSPERYTREMHAKLTEWQRSDREDPFEIADAVIVPLMTEWNLTVDGKPHPITTENVTGLGLFLCRAISTAISGDMGAAGEVKKDSAAT